MTRPALSVLLLAAMTGLVAAREDKSPLTVKQLEALNRQLGQFAGLDDQLREALNLAKQDPAAAQQLLEKLFKSDGFRPPQFPPPGPMQPSDNPRPFDLPREQPNQLQPQPSLEQSRPRPQFQPPQDFDPAKMFGGNGANPNNLKFSDDPRLRDNPGLQKMLQFWEQNVGPLDNNPKLKAAVLDLMESAGEYQTGGNGDPDSFWNKLERESGEASAFGEWLERNAKSGDWKMPDFQFGKWSPSAPNVGGGNFTLGGPSMPAAPSIGGFDLPNLPGGEAGYLLLIVLAAVAAYLAWRYGPDWLRTMGRDDNPLAAARGRWPVDPTAVRDRAGLVRAFEYISLTLCGDAARVWNHRTIAAALRAKVPTAEPVADEVADLYELARYTPPGEELSPADLANARRCLGVLAGVRSA